MTPPDLYRFLRQSRLGVLGTVARDNTPQSALVGIAVTGKLELIFDTLNSSRKHRNLLARPQCSFAIGWTGEQTVQYEGLAGELSGDDLRWYLEIYLAAWPECLVHLEWPGIAHFLVRPQWIRYSDFAQNPPLIQEFSTEELSRLAE